MINKIINKLKNPVDMWFYLVRKGVLNILPDKTYVKCLYRLKMKQKLNLDNPVTFNEKLQWLKLYDRKSIYSTLVDKYEVKKYVADIIGEEHIIPTLGVWDSFDEIDFELLPKQFVLKCTHDSGGIVIVKDKEKIDKVEARHKLESSLSYNFYYAGREWPYKNVKPRIIAEKYMVDETGCDLKDYKIFTFNGCARLIEVHFDRFSNHKTNIYTDKWEYVDAITDINYPNDPNRVIEKPQNLQMMLEFAEKLSQDIPHVRVDFYHINGEVYFGEMTFFHASGYSTMQPESLNVEMGNWIDISSNR